MSKRNEIIKTYLKLEFIFKIGVYIKYNFKIVVHTPNGPYLKNLLTCLNYVNFLPSLLTVFKEI